MATISAFSADDFVDAIGINVHSWYGVSDANSAYNKSWAPLVSTLGIRHVRDTFASSGTSRSTQQTAALALAQDGVDVLYCLNSTGLSPNQALLSTFLSAGVPKPLAVEPWNEYDFNASAKSGTPAEWITDIQSFQPTLYSGVKGVWSDVTVLGASMGDRNDNTSIGSLAPHLDANNVHIYELPAQTPEYAPLYGASQTSLYTTQGSGLPIWLTEFGLVNGDVSDPAVETSELAAARLIPRTLLYAWAPSTLTTVSGQPWNTGTGGLGVSKMFIYELLDEHDPTQLTPATEDRFGLYHYDLTPKLAATMLSNMLGLLADPGASFSPGTLGITVAGGAAPFSYILFQKQDGTFWIAYWMGFGAVTDTLTNDSPDSADTPTTVTLTFDRTFQDATFYRPLYGSGITSHASMASSIKLSARLDVQLVRLGGTAQAGKRARGIRGYYDSLPTSNH